VQLSASAIDAPGAVERRWRDVLAAYQEPDLRRSLLQVFSSIVPLLLLWAAMLRSLEYGYWLTLLLAVPAAAFEVRLFMLQHDCAHRAFFRSPAANDILGFCIGLITLTPHRYWRRAHSIHHATSGNLDRRRFGDLDTLTVAEYLRLSPRRRLMYRLYRHPLVLFGAGATFHIVIRQRFPGAGTGSWTRERASIHATNAGIVALLALASAVFGLERVLLVQAPIVVVASAIGVWFFYGHHQFEDTYWESNDRWDYVAAGIRGSSHYTLPKPLEWMTCHIGLHHIHHLCPRIPNYRLQECYDENPALQQATRLTFRQSLRCVSLKLWDEEQGRLVGYP
jgi:acyl-lipid omega-6 desaturase (Delta-12 desaturase)